MSCGNITVAKNSNTIIVAQPSPITLMKVTNVIRVCSQSRIPRFKPYSFTATEQGQTVFGNLPALPIAVITLAITGALQNPLANTPDFTVTGLQITLSQGVNIGDTIYGVIQI